MDTTTLEVIRHITQKEYKYVVILSDGDETPNLTPMGAICYMASIDPSHYNDFRWRLEGSLEKDTLLIYKD